MSDAARIPGSVLPNEGDDPSAISWLNEYDVDEEITSPGTGDMVSEARATNKEPSSKFKWCNFITLSEILLVVGVLVIASGTLLVIFGKVTTGRSSLVGTNANQKQDDLTANATPTPAPVKNLDPSPPTGSLVDTPYDYFSWLTQQLFFVELEKDSTQREALMWLAYTDVELESQWKDMDRKELQDRVEQRYALAVFHLATGGWTDQGGWTTFSGGWIDECSWPGIFCNLDNRVTSLEIDPRIANIVEGSIPTEIGMLSHLESLYISNTRLTGTIPSEIYALPKLYALRIAKSFLKTPLSAEIGSLSQLSFLDLNGAGLIGTIPPVLGDLKKIRFLFLSNNPLTGAVPSDIGKLDLLEKFEIDDTMLGGSMPSEVCKLRDTSRLRVLIADCSESANYNLFNCSCCTLCL